MKTFTLVICLFVFGVGVGLVLGDSSEELNAVPSRCQQCLEVLSLVRVTRDSSELTQGLIDLENKICESECNDENEINDAFIVSLKDCQMCVNVVNKINSHYRGRDSNALSSALSYGCSMMDFTCKSFINGNRSQLVRMLQSNKDAHVVCRGVHKC